MFNVIVFWSRSSSHGRSQLSKLLRDRFIEYHRFISRSLSYMGITGESQKTTGTMGKLKHSIAQRNRPTRHRNALVFPVVVERRFHWEFEIHFIG
jgi:hypothetical protein